MVEESIEERDAEALLLLDSDFRAGQQQGRAQAWGEQYPAATDWLRRDARELTWREQERRRWAQDDRKAFDERAPLMGGFDAAGEDDWRVDEFRELLEKEKGWRTEIYKWWLGVWDASGDDYLFQEDYQNRLEFDRGFESARREVVERWQGSTDPYTSGRRFLPPPGYGGWDDDEDDEVLRRRRLRSSDRGSRREVYDDDDADENDDPSWRRTRSAARSSSRRGRSRDTEPRFYARRDTKDVDEDERVSKPRRRRFFGFFRRLGRRRQRREAEDSNDDFEPSSKRRGRRGKGRDEEEERPAFARSARSSESGSRAKYVDGRLARLQSKVEARASELEEEEEELSKRLEATRSELRMAQAEIRASGEMAEAFREMEAELAGESKGARARLRSCERACEELSQERMTLWAALDEVDAKLAEIKDARAALSRQGLRGLRGMIQRGRASKSLRTFLEKIL